jgi:hypothetical protein
MQTPPRKRCKVQIDEPDEVVKQEYADTVLDSDTSDNSALGINIGDSQYDPAGAVETDGTDDEHEVHCDPYEIVE